MVDFPSLPSFGPSSALDENTVKQLEKQEREKISGGAQSMLAVLKKKLRACEEELQQTRGKYSELKELCARQCVREADLQNFINEHRLRGNLVIRNPVGDRRSETIESKSEVPRGKVDRGTNTISKSHIDYGIDRDEMDEDSDMEGYTSPEGVSYVRVTRDHPRSVTSRRSIQGTTLQRDRQQRTERFSAPSDTIVHRYERVSVPQPESTVYRKKSGTTTGRIAKPPRRTATSSRPATGTVARQPPNRKKTGAGHRTKASSSNLVRPWI